MSSTAPVPSPADAHAPATLSARLRAVSFSGHGREEASPDTAAAAAADTVAEAAGYYDAFLEGRLNRRGMAAQVGQHYLMYAALEGAGDRLAARLGEGFPLAFPELRRLPSLAEDLRYWLDDDPALVAEALALTPHIAAYVERIEEVCGDSLPMFLAHHYTRYLGDLSGGQMIGRRVARAYGIEDGAGLAFYRFEEIPDPRGFKDRYRAMLDTLEFDEATVREIEAEVARGYGYNNNAIRDLDARIADYVG